MHDENTRRRLNAEAEARELGETKTDEAVTQARLNNLLVEIVQGLTDRLLVLEATVAQLIQEEEE